MLENLRQAHPIQSLKAVVSRQDILDCQRAVRGIHVGSPVRDYILNIVHATRTHDDVALGGSPRASIALYGGAQAVAAIRGHDFVSPDDVKRVAEPILGHRILIRPESRLRKVSAVDIVQEILQETAVPTLDSQSGA